MPWTTYRSPIGPLTLIGGASGLRQICFPGRSPGLAPQDHDASALAEVVEQLDEYFAGQRTAFAVDLDLAGGAFRQRVWSAVRRVPYGQTTSYGDVARHLDLADGDPIVPGSRHASAAQKVGWAIAANPIPIVVPCHRVIAADGALTGYLGDLRRKQALLDFEASGGLPAVLRRRDSRQLSLL
jgi:methylated-DNA-[protein]-cysteine S-methyltransferase